MPQLETINVALAGNPNVGKSTVFNALTGLKQHTGNWPGKTVESAVGECKTQYEGRELRIVLHDLPGTYSLISHSAEEEVARDYICFEKPDVTLVVVDATCLERNLNLCLQVMELCPKVIVCVNLADEAKRKKIYIDTKRLSALLGAPVCLTSARSNTGLKELLEQTAALALSEDPGRCRRIDYGPVMDAALNMVEQRLPKQAAGLPSRWLALTLLEGEGMPQVERQTGIDFSAFPVLQEALEEGRYLLEKSGIPREKQKDKIVSSLVEEAGKIVGETVSLGKANYNSRDRKIDQIVTSKHWGFPIMLLLLGLIFWITVSAANYPSGLLSSLFGFWEGELEKFCLSLEAPGWVTGLFVQGIFRTLGWVISVMLPPMAIFFPLFTILEDLGYLPRIAFNLDNYFRKAHACGKQALTICQGFGCNAVGVTGCRIISSPRERLIAILTNTFVPCNGRFPTLIAIITMYFTAGLTGVFRSVAGAALLVGVILLGIFLTLVVSRLLSQTVLRGVPSTFTLELPPYRRPQVGKILVRSFLDRTLFVLGRAVAVAAPAGAVIWLMANVQIGDASILTHCASFLDPFARLIGLDGYLLMAFLLGFPANEIVIPIVIMCYLSTGQMMDITDLSLLRDVFTQNGWTVVTAVCTMLFSLVHFPCATTLLTIRKETKSLKWTLLAFFLPLCLGILLCAVTANVMRLFL